MQHHERQDDRAGNTRFNAAFANGATVGGDVDSAAACTITTVESLTDVFVDGFVVVDFAGFQNMVTAIGGVPICIPEAIDSPKADLKLDAGWQTLDGAQALGFARARYGVGDGSDLSRIGRQQQLLAATVNQVLSKNLLSDLGQIYGFVDAGTKSLTMSDNLSSIPSLAGLAFSLQGATSGNITFMTVPHAPDPRDPDATVVWTSEADELWAKVRADEPIVTPAPAADQPADDAATDAPPAGEGDDAPGRTPPRTSPRRCRRRKPARRRSPPPTRPRSAGDPMTDSRDPRSLPPSFTPQGGRSPRPASADDAIAVGNSGRPRPRPGRCPTTPSGPSRASGASRRARSP